MFIILFLGLFSELGCPETVVWLHISKRNNEGVLMFLDVGIGIFFNVTIFLILWYRNLLKPE